MRKRLLRSTLNTCFCLLLADVPCHAQDGQAPPKQVMDCVNAYLDFFYYLGTTPPGQDYFESLFFTGELTLDNDYYMYPRKFSSAAAYYSDIFSFLFENPSVSDLTLEKISPPGEMVITNEPDGYHVFVYKALSYYYNNSTQHYAGWQEIVVGQDAGSWKIAALHNVSGPPIPPPAPPVKRTRINTTRLVRQDRLTAKQWSELRSTIPPSARFSIELEGGALHLLHNSFSKRLPQGGGPALPDSGGMARQNGYSLGLSLHFYPTHWLQLHAGLEQLNPGLDEDRLQQQVKNYFVATGQGLKNVTVTSGAYSLHVLYAGLGFGNYNSSTFIVSVEPLIGQVYSDRVLPNDLTVHISSAQQAERATVSLGHPPFLAYGSKLSFQFGLGRNQMVRLALTGFYLQGHSPDAARKINFEDIPAGIVIPAPDLKAFGASLGVHIILHRPGRW